jgi:predicted AAA+ superfamily ATPase
MKILPRNITQKILDALKISPVVFVNGPRQAGKSTVVQSLGNKEHPFEYVSFDSTIQIAAATQAPLEFLTARKSALIIDEVQMVPELFRTLKIVVDELRFTDKAKTNGHFLLTGSANIMALPKLSDPLVGRMSVITLYPFSSSEKLGTKGNALERLFNQDFAKLDNHNITLLHAMQVATFPEISNKKPNERLIWFDGYLSTILQRDVRMLADLEKIAVLPTLLRVLASRAGSLLNDADIARDVGLNPVTCKVYRNILEMMFFTLNVRPWFRNLDKRLVKSPKGYLLDTLLLSHLLDYRLEDLRVKKPDLFGHIVENFVATELTKLLTFSKTRAQLFHFRTSNGKEVDFVLERPDGSIAGIEVKTSERVEAKDFAGLHELASLVKEDFVCGIVLYQGKAVVPFGKNLWAVPFYFLWQ